MHVENGVFKNNIKLLLDISSKIKDGLSAHKDLQALEIRKELQPQQRPNGKAYLPSASYTLTTRRKGQCASVCAGLESPQDSYQT
jgi:hypothetical protein